MKILLAAGIYPPEIGGPATYAGLLKQELPKRGIEVSVLPFSTVRKYPKIIRHLIYFLKILKKGNSVDIIFSQDPISTGLPAVCAGKILGKKVILRIAGDYVWEQSIQRFGVTDSIDEFQKKKYGIKIEILRKLQAFVVYHADVTISPSKYFAHLVSGWNNYKREVIPIYNGIDLSMSFEKKDKFKELTIITAGRLVPWKGIDVLIKQLPLLPNWRLLIAGDGPDKERLFSIVNELGLGDRVEFLGQLTRKELFEKINCSHIFSLLSTFESFSFQLVEAMYIGTPVIALNIGNLSEIITNNVDGILISNDNNSFIEAVRKISTQDSFRADIVEKSKKRANDFSIEKTLDALVQVFKNQI